jgi:predicted DNA-binding transcriptional regulator YafY
MARPRATGRTKSAGQLLTRPPLDRMHRIFRAIKNGQYPNRMRLADEIEVTTKTIQRDIDFMRDRFSLPITYNLEKGGYQFSQPVSNFPMVELTEAEVIAVFVAQKALAQYKGTPFEHPLRSAFEKLTSSLQGKITLSWGDLDSLVSFRTFEITPLDLFTFQAASEAVQKSRVIEFEYKKLNFVVFEKRRIEPYHLACILNQWYCFGYDKDRREMRTFVLARMRKAVISDRRFDRPKRFSIKEHLKGSFGVFSGKGSHRVRIRFDTFAAQLIRERVWHPSQQIQELTGGGLELTLTLSSLLEIEPWVLSWGAHARVLGPKELIRRVIANAQKQLSQYP